MKESITTVQMQANKDKLENEVTKIISRGKKKNKMDGRASFYEHTTHTTKQSRRID